jgi:hypothetical protein
MVIDTSWNGDDLLVAEFKQAWTWQDFYDAIHHLHTIIAQKPHPVHLVIWHHADFPPGNPLRNFQTAFKDQPANTGSIFVIPKDPDSPFQAFMKALVSVVERVNPDRSKVRMVGSLEEARQMIDRSQVQP